MAAAVEPVLVGLCDEDIGGDVASFSTNKIGGLPDCLPSVLLHYPRCALCSTNLIHVVQVYCPLAASPYHRTINVFACPNPPCNGKSESWTALRSQSLDKPLCQDRRTKCAVAEEASMTTRDWCEEADDWGEAEENELSAFASRNEGPDTNPAADVDFSLQMQGLSLGEGGDCSLGGCDAEPPERVPTFRSHYISVMEEQDLCGQRDMEHEHRLLREYELRESVAVEEMNRTFEFQLMPAAISSLQECKFRFGDGCGIWDSSGLYLQEELLGEQLEHTCRGVGSRSGRPRPKVFQMTLTL
ncbi:hypothetical protein GJAV_G00235110 [Gymnothorax javanicus]|nr:hypothetical protein GJAV_G00235110 [Gymnothorax javanicus]